MSENKRIILDFIEAWNRLDYEAIYAAMTDDIYYHNIPMEPCVGIDAVHALLDSPSFSFDSAQWDIHHIAASGEVVLTERTDKFRIGDKWIAIRVMGTFELRDGKIAKWRDYFDLAEFQNQMVAVMGGVAS